MLEIFVIYDKITGFISGGTGRVDREATPDGSTMFERIPFILAKDPNREVLYLPDQELPNPEKHRVVNGAIVDRVPSPEEAALAQQAATAVAIQNLLDTTAQQRNYDDIFTLISYVDDPDPIFNAEGAAAKVWRSAVWTTARQIKADVIAGTRPMPTVEEVLSEMPAFSWPE